MSEISVQSDPDIVSDQWMQQKLEQDTDWQADPAWQAIVRDWTLEDENIGEIREMQADMVIRFLGRQVYQAMKRENSVRPNSVPTQVRNTFICDALCASKGLPLSLSDDINGQALFLRQATHTAWTDNASLRASAAPDPDRHPFRAIRVFFKSSFEDSFDTTEEAAFVGALAKASQSSTCDETLLLFARTLKAYERECGDAVYKRYGRTFAVVQSSGGGKSTMLRQGCDFGVPQEGMHLHILSLCLRNPLESGFPRRDRHVQDFLFTPSSNIQLFSTKASTLITALFEQLTARFAAVDEIGAEISKLMVDGQSRSELLSTVVAQAQQLLASQLSKTDMQRRTRFVLAGHKLMEAIHSRTTANFKSHFILALDEITSLEQAQIMEIRRLFFIDSHLIPAPHLWLVIAGNNTGLDLAAPVPGDYGSGRSDARERIHFEPFVAFPSLPGPEEPFEEACIGVLDQITRTGRPLFRSLLGVYEEEGMDAQASATRLHSLILQKLLGTQYRSMLDAARSSGKLSQSHGLALLVFRVAFHNTQNAALQGKRDIQKRLRAVLDNRAFAFGYLLSGGQDIRVIFPIEPCIAQACSAVMDKLWVATIQSLANTFYGEVLAPDSGSLGEILAQIWLLAAVDKCRPLREGTSACKLLVFLHALLPTSCSNGLSEAIEAKPVLDDCIVHFKQFHELMKHKESIDQALLLAYFVRCTAILGAVGQSKWDLIIPIHIRKEGHDTVDESSMSALWIQVKNRREGDPPPNDFDPARIIGPDTNVIKVAFWVEVNGSDRMAGRTKVAMSGDTLHIHLWNRFDRHDFHEKSVVKAISQLLKAAPPSSSVEGIATALANVVSGGFVSE